MDIGAWESLQIPNVNFTLRKVSLMSNPEVTMTRERFFARQKKKKL